MRGEVRSQKKDWKFGSFEIRFFERRLRDCPLSGLEKVRGLRRRATKNLSGQLGAAISEHWRCLVAARFAGRIALTICF